MVVVGEVRAGEGRLCCLAANLRAALSLCVFSNPGFCHSVQWNHIGVLPCPKPMGQVEACACFIEGSPFLPEGCLRPGLFNRHIMLQILQCKSPFVSFIPGNNEGLN